MKNGDFVEWNLGGFTGVEFPPCRGHIIAVEGDWAVVRCSHIRAPASPFATFHRNDLIVLDQPDLVRRGASLLT